MRLKLVTPKVFEPLLSPARFLGAYGGRGSGKSHFFAELAIEHAVSKKGFSLVCVREIQKSLSQSVKRLLEFKINKLGVASKFRIMDDKIVTPGNGRFTFIGMQNHTAETVQSLEGYNAAWCEEAQNLSQHSLTILRPTIRARNSEIWFSWNPKSPKDPVEQLLRGDNAFPNSRVVRANWTDNPWFPKELAEEKDWDQRRDPDKYAHVWLGEYQKHSEARVFKNISIDEFETPDDARFYYGADWGFSVDPTVLVRCWIKGRTLFIDREAWKIGCEIDRTPTLFDTIDNGHARNWPIIADSADPQNISYLKRNGYPKMQPSIKGPNSVEQGIEFLKSYDIVIHQRHCTHVADEFTNYSYEVDKRTEEVLPRLSDRKNHTIDSCRYAVEPLRTASMRPAIVNSGIY
jgi:phage terminase large subunit